MRASVARSLALALLIGAMPAAAENVDPAKSGARYVWSENAGWINAEPSGDGGPGMQVDDFEVTGWLWGENLGWISLSCENTGSCGVVAYEVSHDGHGTLGGFAWSENAGWIRFDPAGAGVTIDEASGVFAGHAWSENAGWISFRSTGANPFELVTGWRCDPPPAAPAGSPTIELERDGDDLLVAWSAVAGARGVDLAIGSLDDLRASGGDFAVATRECRADDEPDSPVRVVNGMLSQGNDWFLLRPVNCGAAGSYDNGTPAQSAPRDPGIGASGNGCP